MTISTSPPKTILFELRMSLVGTSLSRFFANPFSTFKHKQTDNNQIRSDNTSIRTASGKCQLEHDNYILYSISKARYYYEYPAQ